MPYRGREHIGKLLLRSGAITGEQLETALAEQRRCGWRLGRVMVSLGMVTEEEVCRLLSGQLGAPFVDLAVVKPPMELLEKVPETLARKHLLFPIGYSNGAARVAMADPLDLKAVDDLRSRLAKDIEAVISTESLIIDAIGRFYGFLGPAGAPRGFQVMEKPGAYGKRSSADGAAGSEVSAPIAKLVESIIKRGVGERASDIHIEPEEDALSVRYRIDGVMFAAPSPPKRLEQSIVSRLKIMARLDIAESRAPQDGGFELALGGRRLEFRVSTFPTIYGESVVIRVLNRSDALMSLEDTGLTGATLESFTKALRTRWGMVIVTGPTGSGKTTTLYAAINAISSPEKTIITIEDPVEYRLRLVRQTQVNPKAGLTFTRGLRSILRQDPDVIMVGEIRDAETARIAVHAAMTGHLVLTTLHTTDAASAITRMMDLGIEPYQIAATLNGALAQRLVRKICAGCAGAGACGRCKGSGYSGRVGVFEFIASDDEVREMILSRSSSAAIMEMARRTQGMRTMREDGLEKASSGLTSLEEVERASL